MDEMFDQRQLSDALSIPVTRSEKRSDAALPREIQERLGQQLRSDYHAAMEKPAYLGDPAVPVVFDQHIQRLAARERARKRGVEAVKAALQLF